MTDGTLATAGLLLESWTCALLDSAAEPSVTVPLALFLPVVELTPSETDAGGCCGSRVSGACTVAPFKVALIVALVAAVTVLVVMVTETEELPATIVAVAGTLAADESLARLTTRPPDGAGPFNCTTADGGLPN